MGRRGPAKTPTGVKLAQGETRPSRVNFLEPRPRAADPVMPEDMDAGAKAVWQRVVAEMASTEIIRAADSDVLRCYWRRSASTRERSASSPPPARSCAAGGTS